MGNAGGDVLGPFSAGCVRASKAWAAHAAWLLLIPQAAVHEVLLAHRKSDSAECARWPAPRRLGAIARASEFELVHARRHFDEASSGEGQGPVQAGSSRCVDVPAVELRLVVVVEGVVLSDASAFSGRIKSNALHSTRLPGEPHDAALERIGDAEITCDVGNLIVREQRLRSGAFEGFVRRVGFERRCVSFLLERQRQLLVLRGGR